MSRGKIFLLTGLSGAGKTTLATALLCGLNAANPPAHKSFIFLDGDELRGGLCSDLGFSPRDRHENIRRTGEVAKLLASQGYHVIMALIAPYAAARRQLEQIVGPDRLRIVHVSCPLEICIRRDPKKNYQKALMGQMPGYTGIADIYEQPENPWLVIKTNELSQEECARLLLEFVCAETGLSPKNGGLTS